MSRLRGGVCRSLTLTRSTIAPCNHTQPDVVARINKLLQLGDDAFVADRLNAVGVRNLRNGLFTRPDRHYPQRSRLHRRHARRSAEGYAQRTEILPPAMRSPEQRSVTVLRLGCSSAHNAAIARHRYNRVPAAAAFVKGYGGSCARVYGQSFRFMSAAAK
jgi:hypothetical protein